MRRYIAVAIRKMVIARASHRCEYCRVPEYLSAFDYHIEHIIGIQHGGSDLVENLAYCCAPCNLKKGPNIGTLLAVDGPIIPLFNPRIHRWSDHFNAVSGYILPITPVGEATVKLLELNRPQKVAERHEMEIGGFFP